MAGKSTTYLLWLKALEHIIRTSPRGFQAELARRVWTSRVHLNDIIWGRKGASLELQELIAEALGYTYEEMVALGRTLGGDGDLYSELAHVMQKPRRKRLDAILRLIQRHTGIHTVCGGTRSKACMSREG